MAGIRWPQEDSEQAQVRVQGTADLVSDDDRSVAADSWSIKSDYGSTLDDEQRHVDAADALSSGTFRAASDYSSDKEEPDAEVETSMLGLHSYWDAAYADDLANFREHGHAGEVWFGVEVMEIISGWTKNLCSNFSQGSSKNPIDKACQKSEASEDVCPDLAGWSVLDVGTGNGLLLQELAKQGFSDLTGTDYVEGAIDLARNLADRSGFSNINFLVDDILDTKLERQFQLVTDKGTLDAIGLHPDGPIKRIMYWEAVSKLVAPGGILVITSCNSTKDELVQEVDIFNQRSYTSDSKDQDPQFRYHDHIRTYPTYSFGGSEGNRVATVAFLRSINHLE
ncbi:protein-lysine N-methyltransferase Mettl10 [Amborella trichopoda]|uniref:Protein-lysine N-methyltransferase AMTR_s00105p00145330 n=1 Tax=Amborella trichopoda TaxID=13333 RepID=W1NWR3_AMBTC|nr:protein-lysine N-methyltransferase Mettl10 [Amborella trichopoda]ERN00083.1 hypothetical protein AMTR_s00105p00145330 [Amborella trichopoda]|eukprot:XP_006837229.1 protein-lysine N-methyltransferase Mettl10 [Amborella trichopoda]